MRWSLIWRSRGQTMMSGAIMIHELTTEPFTFKFVTVSKTKCNFNFLPKLPEFWQVRAEVSWSENWDGLGIYVFISTRPHQEREMSNENLIIYYSVLKENYDALTQGEDGSIGSWIRIRWMITRKEWMQQQMRGVYLIHRWRTAGMLPPAAVRDWGVRTELLHAIPSPVT